MTPRKRTSLVIAGVAAYDFFIGLGLITSPLLVLRIGGWGYQGEVFFLRQSGLFLAILGTAYMAAVFHRPFVWLLIFSKAVAVIFLFWSYLAGAGPPVLLLLGMADGLLGLAVAYFYLKEMADTGGDFEK